MNPKGRKPLDEYSPFAVDKRDMIFKSREQRNSIMPTKSQLLVPNAVTYNPEKVQKKKFAKITPVFGSSVSRNDLSARDAVRCPFVDPTRNFAPAPAQYQPNHASATMKASVLQEVGTGTGIPEPQPMNAFYSNSNRDFAKLTVSKDQRNSPGPGTYDTQILDKLKVLNHQLSTRYHLKPFGNGSNRFAYEKEKKPARNTVDFNQMISVKDVELTAKREAFRDTIRKHKKMANMHANANFISTSRRFIDKTASVPGGEGMPTQEQEKTAYRNRVEANKMGKTIRTGMDLTGSGISDMNSTATNIANVGRNDMQKRSGTQE